MTGFAVHQEIDTIDGRLLALVGAVAVVIGLVGVIVGGALLASRIGGLAPDAMGRARVQEPPRREIGPIEQTLIDRARDGLDLRDRQRRMLTQWGWVDRGTGIATIPIDRAMDIVVARGGQ